MQIGMGNLYLTKNQFGGNKICNAEDNHSYMSNICTKECSYSKFNQAVMGKILIFQEIALNFTYSQKL